MGLSPASSVVVMPVGMGTHTSVCEALPLCSIVREVSLIRCKGLSQFTTHRLLVCTLEGLNHDPDP